MIKLKNLINSFCEGEIQYFRVIEYLVQEGLGVQIEENNDIFLLKEFLVSSSISEKKILEIYDFGESSEIKILKKNQVFLLLEKQNKQYLVSDKVKKFLNKCCLNRIAKNSVFNDFLLSGVSHILKNSGGRNYDDECPF